MIVMQRTKQAYYNRQHKQEKMLLSGAMMKYILAVEPAPWSRGIEEEYLKKRFALTMFDCKISLDPNPKCISFDQILLAGLVRGARVLRCTAVRECL
mmetsp:Transcript_24519/g.49668  ORF Transcript_24519/g.49668 Transcript_24519/m.49668 type:complete len:97 (-) Transcript_24519:43-333(-)